MENDLVTKLKELLAEEDAVAINHYFGAGLLEDYPDEDEDILAFFTEKFFEIDMMCIDGKDIEEPVRKTLSDAIQMIESKKAGKQFVSLKMNLDDFNKVEKLLPEVCPDVSFFLKEADHNLVKLGLCSSAPCIVKFLLDYNDFEDLLWELDDIETDAFNLPYGREPSENDPAYQKYLKYGCLYRILYNAERVYQTIGKVKYVGKSFGVVSLTDGKIYDCLAVEDCFLRVIDDSEEDYLYSVSKPSALENPELCGKWHIVEDPYGILGKYIKKNVT